jgi:Asp-tRNA(Asn)/Glu-tRNA(Gln) amidotransferase A subunit family amidase
MSKSPETYPRLFPSPDQTIAGIGRTLREGRTSCVEILNGCFAQVDEWEPKVHAWVVLDREGALEQARGLDDELKNGKDRGPLHGIPIGIKDIIDVAGLPTACGSKRWADKIADSDADLVATLREAGAVIMGKTVTTPYAWIDPPITCNPWNLDRTPGGSSSGSAAAVACGMCLGAIGTQTGGSITRPASFCGVAGMKPSSVYTSKTGVFPLAPSLDHVGPIARTVEDLRLLFGGIIERWKDLKKDLKTCTPLESPPRLGRLRGFFEQRADAAVTAALDHAVDALAACGAEIVQLKEPIDFEEILIKHRTVMAAEAAHSHDDWLDQSPEDYPPRIQDLVYEGRELGAQRYLRAKDAMDQSEHSVWFSVDEAELLVVITPATVSVAPDRSTTGDPSFNSPWSFTGLPTVSFPIGVSTEGLPVAVQLVGRPFEDLELLRISQWCEQAIRTARQ